MVYIATTFIGKEDVPMPWNADFIVTDCSPHPGPHPAKRGEGYFLPAFAKLSTTPSPKLRYELDTPKAPTETNTTRT